MGLWKRKPAGGEVPVTVNTRVVDASNVEGLRDEIMGALHDHGIDPTTGQTINATDIPGLQSEIMGALGEHGIDVEKMAAAAQQAAFGVLAGGSSEPDPVEQLEKLAELHKKGVLTDWEFDAAKKKLLDEN